MSDLKDILLNQVHNCTEEKPHDCMKNIDRAIKQIQDLVNKCVPEYKTGDEQEHWARGEKHYAYENGYNSATDTIESNLKDRGLLPS